MNRIVIIEALIIAATLLACLGYPASGRAALMLTPGARLSGGAIGWARAHGATIVSSGMGAHHPVLRIPDDKFAIRALALGIVLVAVPTAGCAAKSS